MNATEPKAKLVITRRGQAPAGRIRSALRRAVDDADVQRSDFQGVFTLEAAGDGEAIARDVAAGCEDYVGRVTAVYEETDSWPEQVREAAVRVAVEHVEDGASFSFRVHKRGSHWLKTDTPELEREIGGAIDEALREAHGAKAEVDLEDPDVAIHAEVLGPATAVGIERRDWRLGPIT